MLIFYFEVQDRALVTTAISDIFRMESMKCVEGMDSTEI